ncbi:hypothetical protein M409DRAFT_19505 [Zasmidium cellare ATCC 36951]|uniref:BTB domain-containing protein n=1 Tax=Zasmidium cellare ATCC 36951 TaxID=1080233 RepID=A0A6A6CWV9_ZASCE|nr:uncharacterized protein M409DRAFT_19505 [Zasmidium cellare ATCC 36951]KAF2170690.1 hypothetical protein M409DRAFT_19505 [Zasmidium cellare ATCC 36951]
MAPNIPPDLFAINNRRNVWTGDVIVVLVGSQEKRFIVHETPLRENSAFFEAALGRDWKETADRVVKLPEEAPYQFHVYVHWLYRGLYRGMKDGSQFSPRDLARLYTLGSRLQDHDFQDAVVDAFIYRCGMIPTIPDDNIVYLIFSNTIEGDPMRRFLVHVRVRAGYLELSTMRSVGTWRSSISMLQKQLWKVQRQA